LKYARRPIGLLAATRRIERRLQRGGRRLDFRRGGEAAQLLGEDGAGHGGIMVGSTAKEHPGAAGEPTVEVRPAQRSSAMCEIGAGLQRP